MTMMMAPNNINNIIIFILELELELELEFRI
jgi:hypothetical protein